FPFDKADFKPHPKSMPLVPLACHIVESVGWADVTCNLDKFVLNMEEWKPFQAKDNAELLAKFEENLAKSCAIIAATPDEKMFVTWTMEAGGKVMVQMPRAAVLRGFIISHLIHHRAQLGVYLRMLDVALPSVYGPTADSGGTAAG